MSVMYLVLPLAFVGAGLAVWAFLWAVRGGQFDDLDTPPMRMLLDDEDRPSAGRASGPAAQDRS